jgi:hypothetical protein
VLDSCSHSPPEGRCLALVGRQGGTKPGNTGGVIEPAGPPDKMTPGLRCDARKPGVLTLSYSVPRGRAWRGMGAWGAHSSRADNPPR